MTLFVQDTFAEARRLGITAGFVGTYAELQEATANAAYDDSCWDAIGKAEVAYERYLESNWPGAEQYRAEEEADRDRNPFDLQAHYLVAA